MDCKVGGLVVFIGQSIFVDAENLFMEGYKDLFINLLLLLLRALLLRPAILRWFIIELSTNLTCLDVLIFEKYGCIDLFEC